MGSTGDPGRSRRVRRAGRAPVTRLVGSENNLVPTDAALARSASMPVAVADAGGRLVLAGLLDGMAHDIDEVLVLDATSLLPAEYLALRHEGAPDRARTEFALAMRVVAEWFPVRAVAIDTALATGSSGDVDAFAALGLAESLNVSLVTKNRELTSTKVSVLFC